MKLLRYAKIDNEPVYLHDFASHLPFLCSKIKGHRGPILEIGCGFYSTPLLYSHGASEYHWIIEDKGWANLVKHTIPGLPPYVEANFDDLIGLEKIIKKMELPRSTFVFMDFERPPAERRPVLEVLLRHFDSVCLHDANWVPLDGLASEVNEVVYPSSAQVTNNPNRKTTVGRWQLITYYTPSYEKHYERLKESCSCLGVDLKAYARPSQGKWVRNCGEKAKVIKQAMEEATTDYIVWTDADSTLEMYPALFDVFEGVIGVHYKEKRVRHLCSGTMIFKTPEALPIVEQWIDIQDRNPDDWDQWTLEEILKRKSHKEIPAAYCCIFDAPDMLAACENQPVFLHHQGSRSARVTEDATGDQLNGMED